MRPIGYLELIDRFGLDVVAPRSRSYVLERGHRRSVEHEGSREEHYSSREYPGDLWTDHLLFALKREYLNLEVLAAVFAAAPTDDLIELVRNTPTSRYARMAWFFFEWLTGERLPVADLTRGNYVAVLDDDRYLSNRPAIAADRVRRQRLLNNLPGTPQYCPLVRRTALLQTAIGQNLEQQVRQVLSRYPAEVVSRAAQFLFVKETKSSYQIESLRPDERRTARFVDLLRKAGTVPSTTEGELAALQRLIVDPRYGAEGFRTCQSYVGQTLGPGRELIHYVPPRPEDVQALMSGWATCNQNLTREGIHPVVAAAIVGFGFVFLHPFEDGNGRLHRFLIHHVLAATGFTPEGVVFPVSAVMLRDRANYDACLESYSREILRHVEYQVDATGRLAVLNETASHYRYPDLTGVAEALFGFIRETIDREFSVELEYLTVFDEARQRLSHIVDMPDRRLDLFIRLAFQGQGRLSRSKRAQFEEITDDELSRMEGVVAEAIQRLTKPGEPPPVDPNR